MLSDAEIVDKNRYQWDERGLRDAVLRGDEEAWRVFHDQCFDSIYAFIDFRTGHRQDLTEEVAQECWMIAVRRIERFDPARASFENWMRGIAANVLRNHWRTRKGTENIEAAEAVSMNSDAGSRIELAEQIGMALTALPDRYRTVLHAKYEDKLSVIEIARKWGESPKAVESLLTRARGAFRKAYTGLEKEG
jgi:RNA polymerase sigma-70 factor (ECF subfamily)